MTKAPTAQPAALAAAVSTPMPAGGGTHTVRRGDNLFRIALRYGTTVQALASTNGLADPRRLSVGQVLVVPGQGAAATVGGRTATIRYSWSWPPLGGPNCSRFVNDRCVSRMASGLRWEDWVGKAVACPKAWPFGTKVHLDGREWTCQDRGGKIICGNDGSCWVDFLVAEPAYKYGTVLEVHVE